MTMLPGPSATIKHTDSPHTKYLQKGVPVLRSVLQSGLKAMGLYISFVALEPTDMVLTESPPSLMYSGQDYRELIN